MGGRVSCSLVRMFPFDRADLAHAIGLAGPERACSAVIRTPPPQQNVGVVVCAWHLPHVRDDVMGERVSTLGQHCKVTHPASPSPSISLKKRERVTLLLPRYRVLVTYMPTGGGQGRERLLSGREVVGHTRFLAGPASNLAAKAPQEGQKCFNERACLGRQLGAIRWTSGCVRVRGKA